MKVKLYGIPNCNSVKKAMDWLKANNIEVDFHDFKKKGIGQGKAKAWCKELGWEVLVNKKGTTWRSLSDENKAQISTESAAIALMMEMPSVIKRPVIETADKTIVGFDEALYKATFI